jgi:hypothetical protein
LGERAREWMDLRGYLQGIWHEVAYDGLNSAVCGTLSNMAIAMIQRSAAAIFVDFPGHDDYETVMNTITRGDVEKGPGDVQYKITLWAVEVGGLASVDKVQEAIVDVKEQMRIHAYQDLVDFVEDFQKTRGAWMDGPATRRLRPHTPRDLP